MLPWARGEGSAATRTLLVLARAPAPAPRLVAASHLRANHLKKTPFATQYQWYISVIETLNSNAATGSDSNTVSHDEQIRPINDNLSCHY
ncbi:hypothetical protein PR001_g8797 [Phytophthora rubi]|uniref:Uncharacterized protein n=1 Tax=Phytophthora rubi TaxID=129364 RepID=A0A6A3I7X9_9STRA|nr:hypothetical protein PR002_g24767 [Phytophthora rubi]KAE9036507.1 hypothetical protein PR001_g8797 [Phytophthora rubi]